MCKRRYLFLNASALPFVEKIHQFWQSLRNVKAVWKCPADFLLLECFSLFLASSFEYNVWKRRRNLPYTTRLITTRTHVLLSSTGNIMSYVILKLLWYFCQFTLSRTCMQEDALMTEKQGTKVSGGIQSYVIFCP